jgi:hypothetical protein
VHHAGKGAAYHVQIGAANRAVDHAQNSVGRPSIFGLST